MSNNQCDRENKARRTARAEAAVWIVRLHSEVRTPELEGGLREWLAANRENAREFEHITDVWDLAGGVTADGLPRMRSWGASPYRRWSVAAVAAAVCAVGLLLGYYHWIQPVYATGHGEQRLLHLKDGSRISLNSNTRVRVELSSTVRRVRLERGESFFEVAKDEKRPFIVVAGDRKVTALGTTFVVRHEPGRTAITLLEGRVKVVPLFRSDSEADEVSGRDNGAVPTVLTPGERLTFTKSLPPAIDTPRVEVVTAWRRGEALLDTTPLSEAVAEMNRYDTRELVIDEENLAEIRVSGVYRTGDNLGFARAVAELHSLKVIEEPGRIHLRPVAGTTR